MSGTSVNLDTYCVRVGYDGPRTPTLETLHALLALHPAAIPFEAIDVLLGRGVDLSPAAVDAKIVGAGRGGYCFEHNSLLKRVLETIGFEVECLAGRVRWMRPEGAPVMPRTHMVLKVTVNGEAWLADGGFSGCVPTSPLRLSTAAPQPTGHEDFRVVAQGASVTVEARREGVWLPLYEVMFDPQFEVDYEVANWFTATHASSPFKRNLIVSRATPQARYALLDNRLTVRTPDGHAVQTMLDAGQIERTLSETFRLPFEAAWRPVIAKAAAS